VGSGGRPHEARDGFGTERRIPGRGYPAVERLRKRLKAAGSKTGAELEADIYNHLLQFFGRYYDEGDFISQRRYKGDTYAIPYSGEEVTLHWANKDQYYIKSGEWHKDYRFKLSDGRRVRFALVDATQETGNNKEPDEAKRRYILVDDNPVVTEGDTLTFRLHFQAPSDAEKERAADGAVAIFGGDYAKDKSPKKGDERTQFDAFTARNTFDYFIHKDLGGFLRRELDFYIKNEVVSLDTCIRGTPEALVRVQGRVKAISKVARSVTGLGFFQASNFFPDFLLWVHREGREHLAFVDPKGLHHFNLGDPKVQFASTEIPRLQEIIARQCDDLSLHAFILSNTAFASLGWADGGRTLTREDLADLGVLFQTDETVDYIGQLMRGVLAAPTATSYERPS
jgi:hypothetical protein